MDSLIKLFHETGVRYVLIGGQAIRLHGLPRFSMDWDIFVPPRDANNFAKISEAMGEDIDIDLLPLGPKGENIIQTYPSRFGLVQFHLAVPGLPSFDLAESRAVQLSDENEFKVKCLCVQDLLASKLASNRAQDQQDILFLREKIAAMS